MKSFIFFAAFLHLSVVSFSQKIILVKDSIVDDYMKNGAASKQFKSEGTLDHDNKRKGFWKDYEVIEDGSYQVNAGAPAMTTSRYLFYGEGEYANNKRTGAWKFYVVEDKTFRKILSHTLTYADGQPDGSFVYYYPNGKIAQEGTYVSGKLEGSSKLYYPGGFIFSKMYYVGGKKNGRQDYFLPNGKLDYYYQYADDHKNGAYESYYPDGKIREKFFLTADIIDGVYRYYYPSGKLWTEKVYKSGRTMDVVGTYDQDGKEIDKGTLTNGNGYINFYTQDGKLYSRVTFNEGNVVKEDKVALK